MFLLTFLQKEFKNTHSCYFIKGHKQFDRNNFKTSCVLFSIDLPDFEGFAPKINSIRKLSGADDVAQENMSLVQVQFQYKTRLYLKKTARYRTKTNNKNLPEKNGPSLAVEHHQRTVFAPY